MMELWDVYDKDRNLTGRTHRRGEPLPPGDYHLVVDIWIRNSAGDYLIQKRSSEKPIFPGMWQCAAAGAAQAGDDSLTAALRETQEEIGLDLKSDALRLLTTVSNEKGFIDVWFAELDADVNSLILQKEEVSEARWASGEEIRTLAESGAFIGLFEDGNIPELP
jgi:isopentenyldiphosphate isomerase